MVQPRKEQIKSVNTKYDRRSVLSLLPNVLSTAVAPGVLDPLTITASPGGAETDVPPVVSSTSVGPYPILAGDAISVRLNGGAPVVATFQATDTTASRIAARINAAVGATLAQNFNGRLRLVGTVSGASGSILLADSFPGTLAKLGMAAGTTSGLEGPARGVLTRTADLLGGTVVLKTADGRDLITDGSELRPYQVAVGGIVRSCVSVPGGCPVLGKITYDGTNYQIAYYSSLPPRAQVTTFNSRFDLLDGTDSFSIDAGLGAFNVTFPSPPYTRDQVLTRINSAFQSQHGFSGTGAEFWATVTQPYNLDGYSLLIQVDGGAAQTVTFDSTHTTAALVATRIQASVTGVTATAVSSPYGPLVRVRSNNTNAVTSSLRVWPGSVAAGVALGISAGLYRAAYVAIPYGPDEIRIVHYDRGASSSLVVSGIAQTLTRMGLSAGTFSGSATPSLEPVATPYRDDPTGVTAYSVAAFVPESLEFGDIEASGDSVLQSGLAATASQSYDVTKTAFRDTLVDGRPGDRVSSYGIQDYGKPVTVSAGGYVDPVLQIPALSYTQNLVKQFARGSFAPGAITTLVATVLETPGTNGNPGTKSSSLRVDVDPDATFAQSSFLVRTQRDISPVDVFEVNRIAPVGGLIGLFGTSSSQVALAATNGELKIHDENINDEASAASADRFLRLSSSAGGSAAGATFLRIGETQAFSTRIGSQNYSILQKLNAQWTVTCGDGTNSFGDFSGPNALQLALAYIATYVSTSISFRIQVKRGNYVVSAGNGNIQIPAGVTVVLEGEQGATTTVSSTDGTSPIMFVGAGSLVVLRDIRFQRSGPGAAIPIDFGAGSAIYARDSSFANCVLTMTDPVFYKLYRCTFLNSGTGNTLGAIQLTLNDGAVHDGPFIAEDCDIRSGDDSPVLRIRAQSAATPLTHVDNIFFERCKIQLRSTTVTSGRLTGNCGVLDLDPNGTDARSPTFTGVNIRHIMWRDCNVTANVGAGAISILAHIIPRANGTVGGATWMNIVRLTIDGGRWICPSSSSTFTPFVIAGVGGANFANVTGTYGPDRGGTYISRMVYGYTGTAAVDYGIATSEMVDYFSNGGAISPDTWASFAVQSSITEIRDMRFVNPSQLSTAGDMMLVREILDVDGIRFENYKAGGGGAAPDHRLRIRPGTFSNATGCYARIRNVVLTGVNAPSGDWASDGIIFVEPWFNGSDEDGGYTTIEDCTISGFTAGGAPTAASGIYYFVNGADQYFPSSPRDAKNFTIRDNEIAECSEGINITAGNSGQSIYNLRVEGNHIHSCGSGFSLGISVGATCNSVIFDGNRVVGCSGNPTVSFFIGGWSNGGVNEGAFVICTNNVVAGNGTATAAQIQIFPATGAGENNNYPRGICQGNVCKISGLMGTIQLRNTNGAGVAAAIPTPANRDNLSTSVAMRGVETGHSTVNANEYTFVDGSVMIHNMAFLETP